MTSSESRSQSVLVKQVRGVLLYSRTEEPSKGFFTAFTVRETRTALHECPWSILFRYRVRMGKTAEQTLIKTPPPSSLKAVSMEEWSCIPPELVLGTISYNLLCNYGFVKRLSMY
ncbi:UNVERIFIED_CONTAM: hypothetical protein FKN15_059253 [Acipenser sinensis]